MPRAPTESAASWRTLVAAGAWPPPGSPSSTCWVASAAARMSPVVLSAGRGLSPTSDGSGMTGRAYPELVMARYLTHCGSVNRVKSRAGQRLTSLRCNPYDREAMPYREVAGDETDGAADERTPVSNPSVPEVQLTANGELAPGTLVGELRVEARLGVGGMSTVYSAIQPLIGKRGAIKVIDRQLCMSPSNVGRIIQEARAVNQIGHPNIVDVFAFGSLPDA